LLVYTKWHLPPPISQNYIPSFSTTSWLSKEEVEEEEEVEVVEKVEEAVSG